MKKNIFLVFIVTIFLFGCGGTESKKIDWNGTWNYSYSGGTTNSGVTVYAEYVLIIDGENCNFKADGYQLGCNLTCRGEEKDGEFKLFYKSEGDSDLGFTCGDNFDKTEPIIVLTEKNGFLTIKESQFVFSDDLSKVVFQKSEGNSTNNSTKTTTDPIELIRERFKTINDNSSSYKTKKIVVSEESEGGDLTAYYDNEQLKKVVIEFMHEMGKSTEEYYFWDNQLFFVYINKSEYDRPMYVDGAVVKEKKEDRYYYENEKLIKWLDTDKNEVTYKFEETGKAMLSQIKMTIDIYKL